jgi:hypothetical protein
MSTERRANETASFTEADLDDTLNILLSMARKDASATVTSYPELGGEHALRHACCVELEKRGKVEGIAAPGGHVAWRARSTAPRQSGELVPGAAAPSIANNGRRGAVSETCGGLTTARLPTLIGRLLRMAQRSRIFKCGMERSRLPPPPEGGGHR